MRKLEPERCLICGRPATTVYPPNLAGYNGETAPSCGSMRCELTMQAAADYHDERGS